MENLNKYCVQYTKQKLLSATLIRSLIGFKGNSSEKLYCFELALIFSSRFSDLSSEPQGEVSASEC